jgi:tetratricopeptide (TPR) repeat protein
MITILLAIALSVSYVDDVSKAQRDIAAASQSEAKSAAQASYERFHQIATKNPDDFLARSYAGLFAAQRCQYTSNVAERSKYMDEAIPLLDKAVRDATKAGDEQALAETLFNRAEIYTVLPSIFHKEKIALADAKKLASIAPASDATLRARARLLLVRALARTGDTAKAQALLREIEHETGFPAAALKRDLSIATKLVKEAK